MLPDVIWLVRKPPYSVMSGVPVILLGSVLIAQWESECVSLSVFFVARVQFPAVGEKISRGLSLADHTLPARPEPA